MMKEDNRHFTLQIALKCADLCNPCRPWLISQRWSHQVCQEFYRQGDYERQLNLPTTPTFDRNRTTIAKIQADFFKFIVTPLFETWHSFLDSSLSSQLVFNLHYNHCQWKKRVEREIDETIPVAGLVIPHTIDIPSPHDNRDLLVPETLMESEIPITRHPCDTSDLETPTEELNPTTSVMSLSNQKNVLKLKRVRVISQVETYFFKRTRDRKESREKCINGCCTPPDSPVNKTEEPTDKPTTTWCWHISRSLSEERPQQPSKDFDSPAHSWKGSVNNLVPNRIRYRRGSAPMVIGRKYAQCPSDMTEVCGGLRGGGRRWSIPSEPISGTLNITGLKISKDTSKHHSYGLLESHIAITSTECQKEGKNKGLRKSHKLENDGKSILLMGSPIVFSCVAPTGRRGSLPTDLPISLMQTDTKIEKITKQEQWDHNRRRSAGEILSVLFGSAGTLTTIQSLDSTSKSVVSYRRRGSDGLELLYGFWRSRRGDYSGQVFAGRYKLPLSLDTSNIPDWSPKREDLRQFCTNYLFSTGQGGNSGISTFNEHICQRRASVPISVSSLTANSGSPYRSYQDRMS